uniref:SWIM-type domain-containing protein n=1 Tax=Knipowitschia caucasica TaxID=637954 RepID=A0AAV2LNW6_KNICA
MRKSEKAHKLRVVLTDSQPVQLLHFACTCKAGKALCNHCVALLFQSAHYSQLKLQVVPPMLSCTEGEQQWHKPRVMGIKPGPVEKMAVLSAKPKTKTTEGVRSKLYRGLHGELPDLSVLRETTAAHEKSGG